MDQVLRAGHAGCHQAGHWKLHLALFNDSFLGNISVMWICIGSNFDLLRPLRIRIQRVKSGLKGLKMWYNFILKKIFIL